MCSMLFGFVWLLLFTKREIIGEKYLLCAVFSVFGMSSLKRRHVRLQSKESNSGLGSPIPSMCFQVVVFLSCVFVPRDEETALVRIPNDAGVFRVVRRAAPFKSGACAAVSRFSSCRGGRRWDATGCQQGGGGEKRRCGGWLLILLFHESSDLVTFLI